MNTVKRSGLLILGLVCAVIVHACGGGGPQPINYGHDQCGHCKMTISDARFGCQLETEKGRTYNFDDLQCMVAFVEAGGTAGAEVAAYYLPDYANDHKLLAAEGLFLLKSESLKSPMRGDIAAFSKQEDLQQVQEIHGGESLSWEDLWK